MGKKGKRKKKKNGGSSGSGGGASVATTRSATVCVKELLVLSMGQWLTTASGVLGFAGHGKLAIGSPQRALFCSALTTYRDEVQLADYHGGGPTTSFDEDDYSLWNMLSLHLQVHLTAEVAQGLLLEDVPLPADDVLHFTAFRRLMDMALTMIEVEIDMNGDLSTTVEEDEAARRERWQAMADVDYKSNVEELMASGQAAIAKGQQAAKKAAKKMRRKGASGLTEEQLDARIVDADPSSMYVNAAAPGGMDEYFEALLEDLPQDVKQAIAVGQRHARNAVDLLTWLPERPPVESYDAARVEEKCAMRKLWYVRKHIFSKICRIFVTNAIILLLRIRRYNALLDPHTGIPSIFVPALDGCDMNAWRGAISRLYAGKQLMISSEDALCVQYTVDPAVLSLQLSEHALMSEKVHRIAKRANDAFEAEWTPQVGAFDDRVMMAVGGLHTICLEASREPFSDSKERFDLINGFLGESDEVVAELSGRSIATAFSSRSVRWATTYHEAMTAGQYGDLNARVEAVRASLCDVDVRASPEYEALRERAAALGNPHQWAVNPSSGENRHVGIFVRMNPTVFMRKKKRWNAPKCGNDECDSHKLPDTVPLPRLSRCGKCKVVSYCSAACQKVDWKAGHKRMCAILASQT